MRVLLAVTALLTLFSISISAIAADNCGPSGKLQQLCGPDGAEDLVRVESSPWIIATGLADAQAQKPGSLYLINTGDKSWEKFYPSATAGHRHDTASYAACPGAPDATKISFHGNAIHSDGNGSSTLYVVNHGGREAIEVFKVASGSGKPTLTWVGCVPMPDTVYVNSIAFLPGGGFVATKFYDPKNPAGFGAIFAGEITGGVLEWHPESGVTELPGTGLTGANGIEVSRDGKWLYVANWGKRELVRFSRGAATLQKDVIAMDFSPDNLRWASDGKLLVAGQNSGAPGAAGAPPAFRGWTIAKWDTTAMTVKAIASDDGSAPFQNLSGVLEVDGWLWLGPFRGDRMAYLPVPE